MPQAPLEANRVLLVEGAADERFFRKLIERRELNNIQIAGNAGGTGWREVLSGLRGRTGFDQVKIAIIVADSKNDPEDVLSEIQRNVQRVDNVDYPIPDALGEPTDCAPSGVPEIIVITLPWIDRIGSLETLLLDGLRVRYGDLAEDVDEFINKAPTGRFPDEGEKGSKARAACMIAGVCEDDPACSVSYMFKSEDKGFYWLLDEDDIDEIDQLVNFLVQV